MLTLVIAGIVGSIVIIALIIIIRNKPDLWFWLFLNLYFDPGGYVYEFLGGSLLGPLHASDVFLSGMVICLISANINWKSVFQDQFLRKFLFFLFIFVLYYFIVYGGIAPYINNDFDYKTFLIKNRTIAYSFIILIAVYAFSLKSLSYFYTATLLIGIVCLTLFFISLSTGIGLVPIAESARYTGDEMMRVEMSDYGIFYLLFPVSLTAYLLARKIKINLKYKHLLYYAGIVLMIAELLTLTRRVQINIIALIITLIFIISYLFQTGKLSSIFKIIIPALLVILVMNFTFPKYVGYTAEIGEDTFLLLTTGKDSRGKGDQRVSGSGDYKLIEEYIGNNLFFGTGYTYLFWKDGRATSVRGPKFAKAADAAGEVPIYYSLFGFGLVGAILMIPLYYMMANLFFKMIKLLKLTWINYLQDSLTLIFSIYFLLTIAAKFTYKLWGLGGDFQKASFSSTVVLMGLGFALYRKILLNIYRNNIK